MLLLRFTILSVVFLFVFQLAIAQQKDLNFLHLGIEQGLSQTFVRTIYQDSRGFMWFGTGNDGVNKYDGYDFIMYRNDPDNKYSLSNNHINQITEDSDG